jgi:hypothetical protein
VSPKRLALIVAGVVGVALVTLLVTTPTTQAAAHPLPRQGITADRVLPPSMVRNTPDAREAYAAAQSAPQVLDGLYCHCDCARHSGHRSLLTCFESDHGAQCDICIGEALLAARLAASGSSLEQIRDAIDARFQS